MEAKQSFEMGARKLFEMEDGKFLDGSWTIV